jgi:hypothetical protein
VKYDTRALKTYVDKAIREAETLNELAQEQDDNVNHHRFAQVAYLLGEALEELGAEYAVELPPR